MDAQRPASFRSLSSKFSIFTVIILMWVVTVMMLWDIREHTFSLTKGVVLFLIVALTSGLISRFTIRLLARPLALLQQGITSVRQGKFEPIQVSATNDEIEYLGKSFNRMIEELDASQHEIQQHRELLEERIRQRTEDLERALRGALGASQAKSEFLANISHELRTPMNGMLGMLDVVLDTGLQGEQRDQLETAQRCAYSLLALLNDILDLSKIEAGKMMLEKIPFNVRTVVEDCVKSYHARATQKRIALHFQMDSRAPEEIIGDPLRVRQIVTNLLSNAIKFTDSGWVAVRLGIRPVAGGGDDIADGKRRSELTIEVSDTGTGIESDKLAAIFEKFTQADGSITRKYGGTGLGLAITRRLVEMQEGQIQVESKVGKGSTFTVTLLCDLAASPASFKKSQPDLTASFPANSPEYLARLLLVEDNLVNQKVVTAILRKRGYQIAIANDGREALAKLESEPGGFHLILMDVQMPVLDGLETTRLIRRDLRWEKLPIIAMTAHAMNGDRERCLQAGMNAYISKPVQPAHLASMINHYIGDSPAVPLARSVNPIDRMLTDRLMRDDSGMVKDLLQVFLQLAPERMRRLDVAAEEADGSTLAAEAGKIAAAAKQLTTQGMGECAQRIEHAAALGDFDLVRRELETLRQEIRALEALTA